MISKNGPGGRTNSARGSRARKKKKIIKKCNFSFWGGPGGTQDPWGPHRTQKIPPKWRKTIRPCPRPNKQSKTDQKQSKNHQKWTEPINGARAQARAPPFIFSVHFWWFFDCFRSFLIVFGQFLIVFLGAGTGFIVFLHFGRDFWLFSAIFDCFKLFLNVFWAGAPFYWFSAYFWLFYCIFGPGPLVGQAAWPYGAPWGTPWGPQGQGPMKIWFFWTFLISEIRHRLWDPMFKNWILGGRTSPC